MGRQSDMSTPAIAHGPPLKAENAAAVLPELLARAARDAPASGVVYLPAAGEPQRESYAELLAGAERVLSGLRRYRLRPGDAVLLQLDEHQAFLNALWGCFLGGFLPLPVPTAPSYCQANSQLARFTAACELVQPAAILTEQRLAAAIASASAASPGQTARVLVVEELLDLSCDRNWHGCRADEPALLLLTSGSTDRPKVVTLTHRNLTWTAAASSEANQIGPADVNLNWMPLVHIGALAFHIRDVYARCRQVHVPTEQVLARPLKWLDLMHEQRATVCWAPNFAFALVNDRADEIAAGRWDLSAMRVLLNGSEAIVPATVRRFLDSLRPHGLSGRCMVPCWGMSETSAAVTFSHSLSPESLGEGVSLVDTGRPLAGVSLRIVDEEDRVLAEGELGRLQVRGGPVMPGYYRNDEETRAAFAEDGWLKTGDLAILRQGSLTVAGREKTAIIVRGVNYSSHLIEAAVEGVAGVEPAGVAACAVRRGESPTDELAIFYCPKDPQAGSAAELQEAIRGAVVRGAGVNPDYLIPVRREEIPKTPTGKIQHFELRRQFEAGQFDSRLRQPGPGERKRPLSNRLERQIAETVRAVLGVAEVGPDDSFFELGGDSLRATQVVSRLRDELHVELPLRTLFISPTVRELAVRVQETLDQPRQPSAPPLRRVSRQGRLPLSFAQQRLWLLEQMDPGNPGYHVSAAVDQGDPACGAFELMGPLNVGALARSLQEIARRHEILRTALPAIAGRPMQVVEGMAEVPFSAVDLRSASAAEQEAAPEGEAVLQHQAPFGLAREPLWRTKLMRLKSRRSVLFWTLHHIICDGWSVGNLRRELAVCYASFCEGTSPALPEHRIQYADYALWQRRRLRGPAFQEQLAYWRSQLAGLPPMQLLPDCAPSGLPSHRGALQSLSLSATSAEALESLSQEEGGTLFITLLAGFLSLCLRHTGQTDLAVGSPAAGRVRSELEGLIGFFVNTLVLRVDLSGDPTFRELLSRVRETALGAYANQDVPFEKLVEEFPETRRPGGNPLFQVMFAVHNMPLDPLVLPGLQVRPLKFETIAARFDLQWDVWRHAGGLRINAFYRSDLFDSETVERFLGHYRTLLEGALEDPGRRLSELPLMSDGERRKLLVQWNATATAYPRQSCIHEIFEAQVRRAPDAVAVLCEDRHWTYGELNERANRLARQLRQQGVGPEIAAGIDSTRSLETVVAILGVLKAGGAYVPLDAAFPAERLLHMIRDCGMRVVLAGGDFCRRVETLRRSLPSPLTVIPLEGENQNGSLAGSTAGNPSSGATADNLACVMYTSGTTGSPKGVGVLHRGVTRLVRNTNYAEISPNDVLLQLAPLAFDASSFEIWGALLNGARLVIAPPGPLSLQEIERLLRDHRITVLWLTAGLFHAMVEHRSAALGSVRHLIAGGDVLSPQWVREFLRAHPDTLLTNGYGPTENTTFACCHALTASEAAGSSVAIGRPVANTQVYVLDAQLNPVPVGTVGELFLGGDGLARGYLGRPALTAERFLPDPFREMAGARLYRTGDLVRYRADGVLEFHGRKDRQVKIRGFRIEPAEIESVLREHPAVREAAVVSVADGSGDQRLVAYVACRSKRLGRELRRRVQQKLPPSMVPSAIVPLSEIPRTALGKIDYAALPALTGSRSPAPRRVAPRTATEKAIAAIWSVVLKVPRLGVYDNFFDLGGHSLSAMRVVARLKDEFRIELPLRCLFEGPTIAELALAVTQQAARLVDAEVLEATLEEMEQLSSEEVRLPRTDRQPADD